jgi:hypothetical protein
MRDLRRSVLAVVAVVLCAAPAAASSHQRDGDGAPRVTPAGPGLLAATWLVELQTPADSALRGGCVQVRRNVVLPLLGADSVATCTIPVGTSVLIAAGSECSNVEEPPFYGADYPAQLRCAIAADREWTALSISIDGADPVNLLRRRYEAVSRQQSVTLPEGNILGVAAGPATFTAHGWQVLVRNLRPGTHTIVADAVVAGEPVTATLTINVVGRDHDDDEHPR